MRLFLFFISVSYCRCCLLIEVTMCHLFPGPLLSYSNWPSAPRLPKPVLRLHSYLKSLPTSSTCSPPSRLGIYNNSQRLLVCPYLVCYNLLLEFSPLPDDTKHPTCPLPHFFPHPRSFIHSFTYLLNVYCVSCTVRASGYVMVIKEFLKINNHETTL